MEGTGAKKDFITVEEIAEKMNVKKETVWFWIRSKLLQAERVGRSYQISKESFEKFQALTKN